MVIDFYLDANSISPSKRNQTTSKGVLDEAWWCHFNHTIAQNPSTKLTFWVLATSEGFYHTKAIIGLNKANDDLRLIQLLQHGQKQMGIYTQVRSCPNFIS